MAGGGGGAGNQERRLEHIETVLLPAWQTPQEAEAEGRILARACRCSPGGRAVDS